MKNLFAGNLSFQTTENNLRTLLEVFGQVGRVYMPRNPETGQMRGFAFVEMANDEAKKAVGALNAQEVRGQNVSAARPREHAAS
jgi:RNA recognition motif-containing protein